MDLFERFKFSGVRLVAVSQGIDSSSEQADVLMTVHGLVDSLYVKELAKKTHRGMEGKVLHGFHTGGRCFGYRNVRINPQEKDSPVRLEVEEAEAAVVRRIFAMSAEGQSLKTIAKALNAERVSTPRGRNWRRTGEASWCPTAHSGDPPP